MFSDESVPEILRCPLEHLVLNSKLLDMGEPKAILALAMDPPDLSNLEIDDPRAQGDRGHAERG